MTNDNQHKKIEELLYKIQNPQVFTGAEFNISKKPFLEDGINICLVFPDTYDIGMSHYGMKLLYHLLNGIEGVNAERAFLPERESIEIFRKEGVELFSLENRMPLKSFDMIGFSLLTEMGFTNVLEVLDLSGIPVKRSERDEKYPVIAAGGISVVNPEPMRDFIDFFAIGDGEVIMPEIVDVFRNHSTRAARLDGVAEVNGVYVPEKYEPVKKNKFFVPELKKKIRKRVLKDMDRSFPWDRIVVPVSNVVFNRLDVEIARGCPQTCRFCQARSYYAPFRAKSLEENTRYIHEALRTTGFEAFSISSLSSGDYPGIVELLKKIPNLLIPCTAMSVSSLRPSTISDMLLDTISQFRKTGLTIVPEAGTERLRKVINKDVADEEIYNAVELALKYRWKGIKLYFMIGLPTETEEDILGIVNLIKEINKRIGRAGRSLKIHASFSAFVPKAHTPLQWSGREAIDTLMERTAIIKKELRRYRNLDMDFHSLYKGQVETLLSRGDYRVGEIILKAFREGEIFSAWDSEFNYSVWEKLIEEHDGGLFIDEIDRKETLPWEFLEINYKEEHLDKQYTKALKNEGDDRCSVEKCPTCGGCFEGYPAAPDMAKSNDQNNPEPIAPQEEKAYRKVRLFYEKSDRFVFFSHLSMVRYVERIIRMSGIKYKATEGFRPRLSISYIPALPVYATGMAEVVEFHVEDGCSREELLEKLRAVSGELKVVDLNFYDKHRNLSKDIAEIEYEIDTTNIIEPGEESMKYISEGDTYSYENNRIKLRIDYKDKGQERFAKFYKTMDPEKNHTYTILRKMIHFKAPLDN